MLVKSCSKAINQIPYMEEYNLKYELGESPVVSGLLIDLLLSKKTKNKFLNIKIRDLNQLIY